MILKHEFKPRGSMMRFDFGLSESRMIGMVLKRMFQTHCSGPPCLDGHQRIWRPSFRIYVTPGVKTYYKKIGPICAAKKRYKVKHTRFQTVHLKMNESFYNLLGMEARWS